MRLMTMLAAGSAAALLASQANAITVDGQLDSAYGLPKSVVTYDPDAPTSNFSDPTPTTNAQGYDIYLASDSGYVYAFLQAGGLGTPVANFANLYFDLDPQNNNGSDLGFEINPVGADAFIPGVDGKVDISNIQIAASTTGTGLEIGIPDVDFTTPIAELDYYPGQVFPTDGDNITLRLSQSFGYSVAGGPLYGPNRLGTTTIGASSVSAAPEPSTWGLMMAGVAIMGGMLRFGRRRGAAAIAA